METLIIANNLKKSFGKTIAIDDVSLQLEQGDIFGLVGNNGSGKTTLLSILATAIKPTSGDIHIFGHNALLNPQKVRGSIGYLPISNPIYLDLKVWEYLDFFAGAYRIPKSERKNTINDIMELTDLMPDKSICRLSDGMMKKLGLATTLIHDPSFILLDEPLYCIDPRARIEIMEILKALGNMGKTLIISSGIISDLVSICNKIGVMKDGKLTVYGDIDNIDISDYI